jgi:3-hydroxymyristoyl/3-hydroxydecanoyl-(acyl carrier protein) dehydratase
MTSIQYSINKDHAALAGHFPGHPLVPGVVILDEVFNAIKTRCPDAEIKEIKSVKFISALLPDQLFTIELEFKSTKNIGFKCKKNEAVFCSGSCVLNSDCDAA